MYKFNPTINQKIGRRLRPLIEVLHDKLGITPNQVSIASFLLGVLSAIFIVFGKIYLGLIFIILSLMLDGLDGPIARAYENKYDLKFGEKLDIILDRSSETLIILALAQVGYADVKLSLLALVAIFLMTSLKSKSNFDPGFKRTVLLLGPFIGFNLALSIIFFVNLLGYIISMLIIDLKAQIIIDSKK